MHVGFDTSILPICKDSLGWMFNRLDTNYDLLLDQSELGSIYLDKNEQCTKAFFNSCDTYKDSLISNNEWCYCFQRQQGKAEATMVQLVDVHFKFHISLIIENININQCFIHFSRFFLMWMFNERTNKYHSEQNNCVEDRNILNKIEIVINILY